MVGSQAGSLSIHGGSPFADATREVLLPHTKKAVEETPFDALKVDPDKLIERIGNFGWFQMLNIFLVVAPLYIYSGVMMLIPLLTEDPESFECMLLPGFNQSYEVLDRCTVMDMSTGKNETCLSLLGTATSFDYNGTDTSASLTTDYDLVCESESARDHISSVFLFGTMAGSVIVAAFSDKAGRKTAALSGLYIGAAASMLTALAPNYLIFLILRFLGGFGIGGLYSVVILPEILTQSMRDWMPIPGTIFWVAGYFAAGGARAAFTSWRWAYVAISAPLLLTLSFPWFYPESLHWLIANEKKEEAERYVERAVRYSGKDIDLKDCCIDEDPEAPEDEESKETKSSGGGFLPYLTIVSNGCILFHFVNACYLMAVMSATYWVLSLGASEQSENKITGLFLSGLVELPAAFIAVVFMKLMKRRPVSALMMFMTAFFMIVPVFLPASFHGSYFAMSFPLLAKTANSICWNVLPLAMSEMIPTPIRNSYAGGSGFIAEIGSIFAPYLGHMKWHEHASTILIATFTGIGGFLILTMPETKGAPLIRDVASFDEGPFLRRICRKNKRIAVNDKKNQAV